jgi:hypothetical protein
MAMAKPPQPEIIFVPDASSDSSSIPSPHMSTDESDEEFQPPDQDRSSVVITGGGSVIEDQMRGLRVMSQQAEGESRTQESQIPDWVTPADQRMFSIPNKHPVPWNEFEDAITVESSSFRPGVPH